MKYPIDLSKVLYKGSTMWKKLIAYLSSFFAKSPPKEIGTRGMFSLQDMLIYSYESSPGVFIHADPIVLYRRVMTKGPDLGVDIQVASSPSKDAAKAKQNLLKNIRLIFGVKEWDGKEGMTEVRTTDLLDDFLIFCENVKKNSRISATLQMEMSHSCASSSAEKSPTGNTVASGSTEKEPGTENHPKSATVLPPPSD